MRNFTFLGLGMMAALALPLTAEAVSPMNFMRDRKVRMEALSSHQFAQKATDEAQRMRRVALKDADGARFRISELAKRLKPGTTKTFGWDGMEWVPEDTYTYIYDTAGNVTTELAEDLEGEFARTVSEYNDNGMVTLKETLVSSDGINFQNSKKSEFEYDPILTKVITERNELMWYMDEWCQVGNCYKRIITRNEDGNITSVVIAVLFNGIYDPTQRLTITYGEDGTATEISEQVLNYDYESQEYFWEQSIRISNIVWENTDGQIYDAEDLFLGNNRIKTAHYDDIDDISMDIVVEYDAESPAYKITMDGSLDVEYLTAVTEYTPLENDGYILTGTTYMMEEELWSTREEVRYDDWGLMTLSEEWETEDGFSYGVSSVGEVEYDQEGKPLTYTVSETYVDWETEEEMTGYVIRAEYSDYVDVSQGSGAGMMIEETGGRYYDLQGMPVARPEKGRILIGKDKRMIIKN